MTATLGPVATARPRQNPAGPHRYPPALRTPWYDLERRGIDRFHRAAGAPSLQKYDTAELVPQIVVDPRASLAFTADDDDFGTHRVPVLPSRGAGRVVVSQRVPSGVRILYQPNHERFYAVTVELFCDRAGLPLPSAGESAEVAWVLRRRVLRFVAPMDQVRDVARRVAADVRRDLAQLVRPAGEGTDHDVSSLLAEVLSTRAVGDAHRFAVDSLGATEQEQAWVVDGAGGRWVEVPGRRRWNGLRGGWDSLDHDGAPHPDDGVLAESMRAVPLPHEVESPMWRVPADAAGCATARLRSIWFGVVQTFSGDHDVSGAPRFDPASEYRIRCVARRPAEPGHEHCEPLAVVSGPTVPFRLAAFADPIGTSRRKVSVAMPDLRDVADRALRGPGPGGVSITSPPDSRFLFSTKGEIPSTGSRNNPLAVTCTFSLELFMIVAMFLFTLFLPIVVLVFRVWFLLALRFCPPATSTSLELLQAFFAGDRAPGQLTPEEVKALDEVLGVQGVGAQFRDGKVFVGAGPAAAKRALGSAVLGGPARMSRRVPLPLPDDPLCDGVR